ncbi:MAG: hypothetical protein IJH84_23985, partial [Saccharopolyspora sp.]|nr:hypothetical protein [Saccharopolyspora sp.]
MVRARTGIFERPTVLVLGIDSSTQSTKAVVADAEDGEVLATGKAVHPVGTEVDPWAWWRAAREAVEQAAADAPGPIEALSVAGQQH